MERGTWKHGFLECEGSYTNLHADCIGLGKWLLWQKNREGVSFSCQTKKQVLEGLVQAHMASEPESQAWSTSCCWWPLGPNCTVFECTLESIWETPGFSYNGHCIYLNQSACKLFSGSHRNCWTGGEAGECPPPQDSAACSQRDHFPSPPSTRSSVLEDESKWSHFRVLISSEGYLAFPDRAELERSYFVGMVCSWTLRCPESRGRETEAQKI